MALVGLVISLVMGVILVAIGQFLPVTTVSPVPGRLLGPLVQAAGPLISNLGTVNIFLGAFNLIPAFPSYP